MGDPTKKEITDQEMENFDEKRSEAMQAFSEGEWDKAMGLFTEAIKLNPNPDEPHEMGDPTKKEMTDQEMENFDEKRSEAMQAFSEGEWDKAMGLFTEAIKLNPNSAAMFAKRGTCFLKL